MLHISLSAKPSIDTPTQVMLSIGGDPSSTYTVTWRTSTLSAPSMAQLAMATPDPSIEQHAMNVEALTFSNYGDSANLHSHKVVFNDLTPATLYNYRVGNGNVWSEWFQFKTADPLSDKFSFLYFGDIQNGIKSVGSRALRTAYKQFGDQASFMLFTGDIVDRSFDPLWNEFFVAGSWILGTLPSVATAGNHEYYKNDDGRPRTFSHHWDHIYGFPKNAPLPAYQNRSYFFDHHDVRFISIDSYTLYQSNPDLPQILAWFEQTLKDNPNKWTIVYTHYPIYSCSAGRNNESFRNLLKPLLEKYGVDLVLQGHDHTYCRGFNEEQAGETKNLPLYVVSVAGSKMYKLNENQWSDVTGRNIQLYQHISIEGNTISFDTFDVSENLFDSFKLVKNEQGYNQLIEKRK